MVVCEKKQKCCLPDELVAGDCWIALSLAQLSGLILTGRVGKHTDSSAQELVVNTEGKTDCQEWDTDGWSGYGRVLPEEVDHYISKGLTQRCSCELTALCVNRQDVGIDDKTNSARFGSRPR